MQEISSTKTEITIESSGPLVAGLPDEIKSLLKDLHKMSISEDWSETKAQELIMWGGQLYEKYK